MPSRGLDLRERPTAGQRVRNESVPPVVDRQVSKTVPAKDPAGGVEPAPEDVVISAHIAKR